MCDKYINACFFPYQDCCHSSTDIEPRDDNSPDMEKGMH